MWLGLFVENQYEMVKIYYLETDHYICLQKLVLGFLESRAHMLIWFCRLSVEILLFWSRKLSDSFHRNADFISGSIKWNTIRYIYIE